MKDDLISRKQIMDEAKRLSGPITGDGWDNWGVYALIERQPSVPAVPLDKLCEWLAEERYEPPYMLIGIDKLKWPIDFNQYKEIWMSALTKWMEEQDESD